MKDIIEGCKRKNFRSEELLYKTFYGYVSGVAFRYIKERNMMKELVNDSFLKIFRKMGSFSFSGPDEEFPRAFKGWVGRITANTAIDKIRLNRTMLYIDDMSSESQTEIAVEPENNLSFKDVMTLLDVLPRIQQLIFNMHVIEGFSHEEIAVKLSIPPNTSRVYLKRAKKKLVAFYQADLR
nr:RNA polymerase sigma factor [Pedobacter xinjiangensis]